MSPDQTDLVARIDQRHAERAAHHSRADYRDDGHRFEKAIGHTRRFGNQSRPALSRGSVERAVPLRLTEATYGTSSSVRPLYWIVGSGSRGRRGPGPKSFAAETR